MKRRALKRPFVVTVVAAQGCSIVACSRDPGPTAPSPAASIEVPAASASAIATSSSTVEPGASGSARPAKAAAPRSEAPRLADYPDVLNATDGPRTVFRSADRGAGPKCHVELPWPPGKPRMPGEAPPTQDIPCPAKMKTAAWEKCRGGTVHAKKDKSECICFVMGNPPPLPEVVGCP